MKISSIAIGLAITLTAPVAAQAGSNCGVPQGYGTNNTHTFNRSTCGFKDNSYNVPNAAKEAERLSERKPSQPASTGAPDPKVTEPSAADLGSTTSGN